MRFVSILRLGERLQPNSAHSFAGCFLSFYDSSNRREPNLSRNLFKTPKASQKTPLPHQVRNLLFCFLHVFQNFLFFYRPHISTCWASNGSDLSPQRTGLRELQLLRGRLLPVRQLGGRCMWHSHTHANYLLSMAKGRNFALKMTHLRSFLNFLDKFLFNHY